MKTKVAAVRVKAGPADGLAEGEFTAYASVFGVLDSWGDVVVKGAFASTLGQWESSGAVLPLLWGHRTDDPAYNIGHVAKAVEDDHGLLVTCVLDLENPTAAQTYRLLKGRRIDQMSFAFDTLDCMLGEVDGDQVRMLTAVRLFEVSVVPYGANEQTQVLDVKHGAAALAAGVKAGRVLSTGDESALREARDVIDSVLGSPGGDAGTGKAAPSGGATSDEASGHTQAKPEEPAGAKGEEPGVNPSARVQAEIALLALG